MFFIGCSSLFVKPDVSLVDLKINEVSLFETNVLVKMRVQNTSPHELTLPSSSHLITINNIDLGKGYSQHVIKLKPFDSSVQDVNIRVSNIKLLSKIESLIESKNFSYKILSTFYPKSIFSKSITATSSGEFDYKQLGSK
jgi:LEA14-like dessication related protein